MTKCPICENEIDEGRHVIKVWKFTYWIVKYINYPICKNKLRLYVNSEGKRKIWTIPKVKVV